MARNTSLPSLRNTTNIKNGSDTRIAVDARGSSLSRLKYKAVHTINKTIKIKYVYLLKKVDSLKFEIILLSIFFNITIAATAE